VTLSGVRWGTAFLICSCTLTLPPPAEAAEERRLSSAEIAELLTGNTALGESRGAPTRQFFDASGSTTYLVKGGRPDAGRWKVDGEDHYCSTWRGGSWACYDVLGDDERFYWFQEGSLVSSDYRSPFTVVEGRQMTFQGGGSSE
jgi:hypothetical protein